MKRPRAPPCSETADPYVADAKWPSSDILILLLAAHVRHTYWILRFVCVCIRCAGVCL